jgi:hypothetical protein
MDCRLRLVVDRTRIDHRPKEGSLRRRRLFTLATLFAALMLFAAGCAQDGGDDAGQATGDGAAGDCTSESLQAVGVRDAADFKLAAARQAAPRVLAQGAEPTVKLGVFGEIGRAHV